MTPVEQRTERARQQVTASTGTPPTGIEPDKPLPPPPQPRPPAPQRRRRKRQPLTFAQVLLAVFLGTLLAQAAWFLFWLLAYGSGWMAFLLNLAG